MAIQRRNIFGPPAQAASSGDGSSVESAFDLNTGERLAGYRAPQVSDRLDTSGGLDSTLTRGGRGDELITAYRSSAARHGGIDFDADSNETSCGVELGSEVDRFTTTGHVNPDSNFQSTGTAGGPQSDSRFVRIDQAGIGPYSDSNETASGRPVA
jgi:hypothetical protein